MKTCAEIMERLDEFIEGELSNEDEMAFDAHMAGCPECKQAAAELEITIGAMKAVFDAEGRTAGGSVADRVMEKITADGRTAYPLRKLLAAASVALILSIGVVLFVHPGEFDRAGETSFHPSLKVNLLPNGIEVNDDVGGDIRTVSVKP